MANTTSTSLKLTVQATGENPGTWGQFTNTNLLILEQAIGGYEAVTVNKPSFTVYLENNEIMYTTDASGFYSISFDVR